MTVEKYAIFISLSHDCFIEIIACNTLNRHLVAKDQSFLKGYVGYANCGENNIWSF